jgi:putative polyketide hydroxylase
MYDDKTQALVVLVGGALTGLSSAVFLAAHGVPCVVVERHPDLLIYTLSTVRAASTSVQPCCFARSDWSLPCAGGELCEQCDQHAFAPIRAETLADEE